MCSLCERAPTQADEDIPFEEEIIKNPFSVSAWFRYIKFKREAPQKQRNLLFERALKQIPGSYKLWRFYLKERTAIVKLLKVTDPEWKIVGNAFERALAFLHKVSSPSKIDVAPSLPRVPLQSF